MATHIYDTLVSYDRYTAACPELKLCKRFLVELFQLKKVSVVHCSVLICLKLKIIVVVSWECRLTLVELYSGRRTVVIVSLVSGSINCVSRILKFCCKYYQFLVGLTLLVLSV